MGERDINEWQQLTSVPREGQYKGDIYTADTQAIWPYIISKAESNFQLWAFWWPKRKFNVIIM